MKFKVDDKVNFICRGEICAGTIVDYGVSSMPMFHVNYEGSYLWLAASELALVKLPVVPLYYVVFLPDDEFSYLKYNTIDRTAFVSEKIERDEFKTKFTEKEIKNMNENYWAFAVPVEEVEAENNE
ncbi:DUF1642 domain-containing protein [Listeria innocua]|nr:DUF1642 domain-containing protein [Listeria innocua]